MQLFLEVAVLRKHGGAGSGQPPRGGGVQCARGSAGPPPPPRPSSPGRVPHARRPGSAARGRLPVAAASSGQLAGRGGGRGHPAARPEPCKFAGPGACARECECVPGGGGRNKEPSKHSESVSSKAHKYSSRVLISPTHTHTRARARRNTARAPAAEPLLAQATIAKTTFANCTALHPGGGGGGSGRTHSHSHTHTTGQAHAGGPLPGPSSCRSCPRKRRHWVRVPSAPDPSNCAGLHETEGGGAEGKPKGESVHVHTPPIPGAAGLKEGHGKTAPSC